MHTHHHVAGYSDLTPKTFINAIAVAVGLYGAAYLPTHVVRIEAPTAVSAAVMPEVEADEPWLLAPDEDDCDTRAFRNHPSCPSHQTSGAPS